MAGGGYKLFSAGEVLTAANLQSFGIDQTTMVFASSAARTTALAAPSQGMVSYLTDSGTTWQYFSAYDVSTNPGGAKTAGWYPFGGQAIFYGTASRSAATGTDYSPGASGFAYTEISDTLGWHDPTTNPDRIIPKSEGIYRVTVSVQFAANATGVRVGYLSKNSATEISAYYGTGATQRNYSMSGISYMNGSTDYFNLSLFSQTSGGALTMSVQTMVEYVRPSIV
jgi:hypothetical protein